jgi:hypothetical protein
MLQYTDTLCMFEGRDFILIPSTNFDQLHSKVFALMRTACWLTRREREEEELADCVG